MLKLLEFRRPESELVPISEEEAANLYELRREAWRARRRFQLAMKAMDARVKGGAAGPPQCMYPITCGNGRELRLAHEDWRRWAEGYGLPAPNKGA